MILSRYEHKNEKGHHTLIIKKLELTDAGTCEARTPLNKGDSVLVSSTVLDVMMGERKPTLSKVGKGNKIEGVAMASVPHPYERVR